MKNSILILLFLFSISASADVPKEQQAEVQYLLNFVKTTSCEMIRNGKHHNGEKAASHIQRKYDYFRNKIKTTEDFIEYSASKSTMSGKEYFVQCGDELIKTRDWLMTELNNFRKQTAQ
ncbi:MAG TPA: DUF5329 domain-containing protein [Gammaproteobacteria bacterium]|nr:DUF5329 domain-containing protein [Xanthomonadales bacterium]HOP22351.1 DUF5329 domain-containing protein [Gammaproteobacteria bacterium]HPI94931.1 DUF5329 domain-containing protein [Gammaproteobacteria bacterium]HPQ86197.1 DUF5329 domain-containing protein [Gammaproteobacteria bacterium]